MWYQQLHQCDFMYCPLRLHSATAISLNMVSDHELARYVANAMTWVVAAEMLQSYCKECDKIVM